MRPRDPAAARRVLRTGSLYFLAIFATGFTLGTLRVLWAEPRFGTRNSELMEMPIMLLAIVLGARWSLGSVRGPVERLATGGFALALLVAAELGLVLGLRGLSIDEYLRKGE